MDTLNQLHDELRRATLNLENGVGVKSEYYQNLIKRAKAFLKEQKKPVFKSLTPEEISKLQPESKKTILDHLK